MTSSDSTPETYLSLKQGKALKSGPRSQGYVHYRVLADSQRDQLFLTLIANDSSGCFSREIVPVTRIESVLQSIDATKPIASKLFQSCFVSKSQNNAGFLAAVLRSEHLLRAVPDAVHQHAVVADWSDWKSAIWALADGAEAFRPEPPKPRGGHFAQAAAQSADADNEKQPELSEAEMDLLQGNGNDTLSDNSDDDNPAEPSSIGGMVDKRNQKRQPREKLQLPRHRGELP